MSYKLYWTKQSQEDLIKIRNYISHDSYYSAKETYENIIKKAEKIIQFPKIGKIVAELNESYLREIKYKNYRIIYKIVNNSIFIIAIVHNARILQDALDFLSILEY